jgi:dihydroflavonol-4-reductase
VKVFVTGGNGFIGSRVVRQLVAAGHDVRCLLRETSDTLRIDDLSFERFIGDVRDRASLVEGMQGADGCIHLASVSSWADMRSDALETTIIDGTRHVLDCALEAGVGRFVYISSTIAVNGSIDPEVFDEDAAFDLHDTPMRYAIAKHAAEGLVADYVARGLDVVTVNPCEVYGPDDTGMITAGNLKDILTSWPALACRGGTAVAHVDDIASGIIAALERGRTGERYILGGDNLSVEELVRLTLDVAGQRKPVLRLPNGLLKCVIGGMAFLRLPTPVIPEVLDYATRFFFVDCSKATQELGYRHRPAREVLGPVIDWLREDGHVPGASG